MEDVNDQSLIGQMDILLNTIEMKFKLIILFFLIILSGYAYSQSVTTFKVNTICLENDTSIKFPQVLNCTASDSINKALFNFLQSYFPCHGVKSVKECLGKASSIDLHKLEFSTYNSDSTISFIINIVIRKHNKSCSFRNFRTYSLKTGKRLAIQDIFPGFQDVDFYNFFLPFNANNITFKINSHLKELLNTKVISKDELEIIENRMRYNECQEYFDEFVLTKQRLFFKSYYIIPEELVKFIPDFFIIGVDDMKSELIMNNSRTE
jgi:hypothetical protein